ncbi:MAG: hypothetical protein M1829_004668 [Trizodia sp. TS-e1964]|nr:MAG: hypothetical protein M1829_004668 [Trizodia sp. TS-e1964]
METSNLPTVDSEEVFYRTKSLESSSNVHTPVAPKIVHASTTPFYQSPRRHYHRSRSTPREVKETLNARSEYTNSDTDGQSQHRINQYIIKQEIGRGSFGAVHLAEDQYGNQYAVKEFSKSRLRKRAQSTMLRSPNFRRRPGQSAAGSGFNSPLHRHSSSDVNNLNQESDNPLFFIRKEIAIMKKLNHGNLVSLIEVLDVPEEDSLYMVMEMCKKGVVMKVGIDDVAIPYEKEESRCWFRDLILGIEYLHAHGIIHRDIKPDNLLITEDDVLKIVDFGVSEMFEKSSEMKTAKSAGSPAFLPPELCVVKHGDISGKAADIWSMGISLYCLRHGKIPFEQTGVLDLYEAIRNDTVQYAPGLEDDFIDLMNRILEKDPDKRINMDDLREHPWVTKGGTDNLLSKEENTADLVEPPTDYEMNHAITSSIRHLVVVMKAIRKFKAIITHKRPGLDGSLFGSSDGRLYQPPLVMSPASERSAFFAPDTIVEHDEHNPPVGHPPSQDADAEKSAAYIEKLSQRTDSAVAWSSEPALGVPRDQKAEPQPSTPPTVHDTVHATVPGATQPISIPLPKPGARRSSSSDYLKGHAHDLLNEEPIFVDVGMGADSSADSGQHKLIVSESPPGTEVNIYETAYREEVERIREAHGPDATVYLTKRVDRESNETDGVTVKQAKSGLWGGVLGKAMGHGK